MLLVAVVAISALAQRVEPQSQGKMYGEPGFRGEPINLNVVNADVRDILSYITDQYAINFVIDKSVAAVPVTVKVSDVPWNIALPVDSVPTIAVAGRAGKWKHPACRRCRRRSRPRPF